MFLFLILVLPAALVYYLSKEDDRAEISVVLTGFLSSALFCTLKAFFGFMHRIPSAGFWLNFLYIVFSQTAVPAVVVFLLFVYLSKDTIEFRIGSYFPLLCSFYAVYLPYHIMAGSGSAYSFFELFLKPLMYLAMLLASSICVRFIFRAFSGIDAKKKTVWSLMFAASLLLPAAVETLWFTGLPVYIWLPSWIAYMVSALCAYQNSFEDNGMLESPYVFIDFKKAYRDVRALVKN
jgi:F0F1-type ATP synthase membrane subunit c/vacuolar-type H+-ATPase subunit K